MTARSRDGWMTLAIVLLGVGMLIGFTFAGMNRQSINEQQQRFQQQAVEQRQEFARQTAADIAAAKAAAIAAADAETLAKVCALAEKIPNPPVSVAYEKALGCPPVKVPESSMSPPQVSVPPAGTSHMSSPGARSTGGTAVSRSPALPRPTPTPTPSPTPPPPFRVCLPLLPCL